MFARAAKISFARGSLRRHLFFLISGSSVAAVVLVNLIWLPGTIRQIQQSQAEIQQTAVLGLREQIRLFLDERDQALKAQAALFFVPFLESDRHELDRLAGRFLKREWAFEEVGILDRQGKERLRHSRRLTLNEEDLRDLSASSLFKIGISREISWGPVEVTRWSEPWMAFAVPLKRWERSPIGVVYGVLNLKSLWSLTRDFSLSHGGRAYVVDPAGRLIAADDASLVLKRLNLGDRLLVKELFESSSGSSLPNYRQGRYANEHQRPAVATGLYLPGVNWVVAVEQDQSLLFAAIRRRLWFSFAVCLAGLLLSLGLAHFLGERFARPIVRLAEAVAEFGRGGFGARAPVENPHEIADLARQFNQMADQIRSSQQNLERKVEEKASDLSSLYSALAPLAPADSVEQMHERVIERIMVVTGADAALIRVVDKTTGAFVYPAQIGFPSDSLEATQRVQEGSGVALAFKTGEPVIAANIAEDPRLKGKRQTEAGLKSCAYLPLKVAGEVRGVIHLASRELGHFNEEKKDHLMAIARQMGVAIENRELFEETEYRAQAQAALNAIATATSRSLELKELFDIALKKTVEVTGRGRVNIRLKDSLTGKVSIVAHRGFTEEEIEDLRRRTPHPMSEQVFATGEPLIVNDDARRDSLNLLQQTRSVAWIPITAGAEVVGVLGISDNQSKPFLPGEVNLLQAVGGVIGVAIENARLYEETERRKREAEELARVARSLTETLDMTAVGERIVTSVRDLFGIKVSTLRLLQPDGSLRALASSGQISLGGPGGNVLSPGTGLTSRAVAEGRPIWSADMLNDPEIRLTDRMRDYQLRSGNRSMIAVPLRAHEKIIGALALSDQTGRMYSDSDVALLQTFADQAALALENARLYEEMVKLAADLSRSNKVKDEFLSVMSHELRTPLNVVMGYTGMIKEGLLGEINPEQEKALEKVLARAKDQLAMINSVLQATQMQAEGVRVERREVRLKDFLDDLRSGYEIPLGKELSVIWDYPPELPVVHTDAEKLKQVLQNLINNAIKFTEKGGVTISARVTEGGRQQAAEIRQEPRGNAQEEDDSALASRLTPSPSGLSPHASRRMPHAYVEFRVADTGVGIAKEQFPVIFEKFWQGDSSETRRYVGVGIGLYIVKKFTELLGGKVEVQSELGKGSTFRVTIPCEIYQLGTTSQQGLIAERGELNA